MAAAIKHVRTATLDIAYEESGPGAPVILLHGFPYDPRAFDEMLPLLPGCRVIVPYLRGYGPTRFLSNDTMRSGEQAALGNDLKEMMHALVHRPRGALPAMTGADAPPASSRRCGRNACAGSSPAAATTCTTSRARRSRLGRAGASLLVSVLFPHRARPRRADGEPARHREAVVEAVVAELEVRRRDLRALGAARSTIRISSTW